MSTRRLLRSSISTPSPFRSVAHPTICCSARPTGHTHPLRRRRRRLTPCRHPHRTPRAYLQHTYLNKDSLPDEYSWAEVDGVSYLTKNLNQHIPQVGSKSTLHPRNPRTTRHWLLKISGTTIANPLHPIPTATPALVLRQLLGTRRSFGPRGPYQDRSWRRGHRHQPLHPVHLELRHRWLVLRRLGHKHL